MPLSNHHQDRIISLIHFPVALEYLVDTIFRIQKTDLSPLYCSYANISYTKYYRLFHSYCQ